MQELNHHSKTDVLLLLLMVVSSESTFKCDEYVKALCSLSNEKTPICSMPFALPSELPKNLVYPG